jgi:hypothetical protein
VAIQDAIIATEAVGGTALTLKLCSDTGSLRGEGQVVVGIPPRIVNVTFNLWLCRWRVNLDVVKKLC